MLNKKIKLDFWNIVTLLIIIVFAIFLIYPLLSLFLDGFKDSKSGVWSLVNYIQFFSKKYYTSALVNSFKLTISVTIIAVLIGVPLAYFMSFYKIKGKGILEVLFIISMMSPNFIGAYSWILLLGRNGSVTKFLEKALGINIPSIYGFAGMLLVFSLKLYPFIYIYVSGALKKIDVALSEAAESLGCGGLKKVFTVIMPLITPTLVAAALLVFMNCMADFGTPALIGEGYRVMPTLVYSELCGLYGYYNDNYNRFGILPTKVVYKYKIIYNEFNKAYTAEGTEGDIQSAYLYIHIFACRSFYNSTGYGSIYII